LEKIKIMISSTVEDLNDERKAITKIFSSNSFVETIGAGHLNVTSISHSSLSHTLNMANSCDLYILILGSRYGMEVEGFGKSATEIEYEKAYRVDPTKILVFLKDGIEFPEEKQNSFIERVTNYYSGYWRTTYSNIEDLEVMVNNSFITWLKQRAILNDSVTYVDHFIRLAKERKPEPHAKVYSKTNNLTLELTYEFFGKDHLIIFNNSDIYSDFWGCIHKLYQQYEVWIYGYQGGFSN